MPSLRQLLATCESVLVFDAASTRIQVGWLARDAEPRWRTSAEEAGIGVFRCVQELGVNVADAGCFVFCDGPGSILGIRTVATALRSWCVLKPTPVFAYCSLALVAEAVARPEEQVIADARRDSWHVLERGSPLRRVAGAELAGAFVTPVEFRHWSPLPPGTRAITYSVADLCAQVFDADLFHATTAPDAFLHEEPSYVTWTPRIHRAPTSS